MPIQWFPGHMHATRKRLEETLAEVDVVIELLDARIPAASRNPLLETLRRSRQKPCLKILNKSDLADPVRTAEWLTTLQGEAQVAALALCAHNPADVRRVLPAAARLAPHRNSPAKPLRVMVVGIPNVGKSTLLNALLGRKAAKVGDEPAVTKAVQRYALDGLRTIYDTPGMMWPKIEIEHDGWLLAACHAIGRNAVREEEVALALISTLQEEGYGERLVARYHLPEQYATEATPEAVLEAIGKRRGCVARGGGIDWERAALLLLQDFRDGRLGRITLETPASRALRVAQASREKSGGMIDNGERVEQTDDVEDAAR
ncbi:ribosome biogenesis GTPase YlqF [Hydrogenophilus islandicus]